MWCRKNGLKFKELDEECVEDSIKRILNDKLDVKKGIVLKRFWKEKELRKNKRL